MVHECDVLLVGGGLQNGLIALALAAYQPNARVVLLERDQEVAGNHTWSLHAADVPEALRELIAPLVTARWPCYDVAFDDHRRRIHSAYATIPAERMAGALRDLAKRSPRHTILTGAHVEEVSAHGARLQDGRRFQARWVVDARGPTRLPEAQPLGYQKFLGLELRLRTPGPFDVPLLMDARVPQIDGFRFMYVLPLAVDRILIEDTCFSDTSALDISAARQKVMAYATAAGLDVSHVVRMESGVLPLPARIAWPPLDKGPLQAGYAGGFFHPTTGYSFPAALRVAWHVATSPVNGARDPDARQDARQSRGETRATRDEGSTSGGSRRGAAFERMVTFHRRQARYCMLLNRLFFRGFAPEGRWHVMARFYRLPEPTIARFYAMKMTRMDRSRILCGRPPAGLSIRRLWLNSR